jgi:hypothetical protein
LLTHRVEPEAIVSRECDQPGVERDLDQLLRGWSKS